MPIKILKRLTTWSDVVNAAHVTRGNDSIGISPSSMWKKKMLIAEHSPIRFLEFTWQWEDIPYWVSVHFVRHKYGIEHFVRSQRPSREKGSDLSQNELVTHTVKANAQAIINISKERLCQSASSETRQEWQNVVNGLKDIGETELASCCVPKCCYRRFCPEGRHDCSGWIKYFDSYCQFISSANLKTL